MRFAITSQNFRTITGHAGKARRFILYSASGPDEIAEIERLDLPLDMSIHAHDERFPHPLDGIDILITAGSGDGFVMRMARRGIRVLRTGETDPLEAIRRFFRGDLTPPLPHDHDHDATHDDAGSGCGCGH